MSSKVEIVESMRICSRMSSNAKFNKSKDHKDLIHVRQVGLGIDNLRQDR